MDFDVAKEFDRDAFTRPDGDHWVPIPLTPANVEIEKLPIRAEMWFDAQLGDKS